MTITEHTDGAHHRGILGGPDPRAVAKLRNAQRARDFVETELIPLEEEAERLHGRLPQETIDRIKAAAIEARLNGGLHSPEYGGQGWTRIEWALVEEQFGRSTNGIYWHIPNAYNVWDHASRGSSASATSPPRSAASSRTPTR